MSKYKYTNKNKKTSKRIILCLESSFSKDCKHKSDSSQKVKNFHKLLHPLKNKYDDLTET